MRAKPFLSSPALLASCSLLALLFALQPVSPALAEALPDGPHVKVQGHGEIEAMPDLVIVTVDVTRTAPDSARAQREVDAVAGAVQAVARRFDIRDDDYDASRIQIQPEYEWKDGQRTLLGQRASRQFELTLNDIRRYGELIQALAEADINAIQNIRFDFSNRTELYREAERLAASAARDQAANLAAALGARLGRVYSITAGGAAPAPQPRAEMMTAKASDSAAVRVGHETIEARIDAVFEIKPN